MTLTGVAKALSLDTSSVTYYFKRKEILAAACLEQTLVWLRDCARRAAAEAEPILRVRRFLHEQIELHRRQRDPGVPRLAVLSDMRALDANTRAPLDAIYVEMFQIVRSFFEPRGRALVSTFVLLANIHWIPAWIDQYLTRDLDRVEARLFDVLCFGIGLGDDWPLDAEPIEREDSDNAQTRFLHAATHLINRQGYAGASVEKIAAELGLSTGSFYHHLENKDDLVIACFDRSVALVDRAQESAAARNGTRAEQLSRMAASLIALQFTGRSPLLRTSAYQVLPMDLRGRMLGRTAQATHHVAGTIADGIAEGSIRAVDPAIAAHAVMATINATADLREWAETLPLDRAVKAFVRTLQRGIAS